METAGAGWHTGGSLQSRFFIDDGCWKDAPLLTGQTSFGPLPDVRNILVTGGEGFIASWLVRHLVTKYADAYNVVCFDKLDYCSSLNNARMLEGRPNFRFFHGDIMKESDVLKCLEMYKIDTIFHLAAQSHVDLSFGNSFTFTHNNVIGTHVLLESARVMKTIKRFYHISTDEVYGEVPKGEAELHEDSPLHPTNPYSASKACAEMMVRAYVKSFALPVVMIRLNNVYGPHQFPEKIIPKFINLLQRSKPLFIHGKGDNSRRYLHAGDAADAFDTILHKGVIGEIYNVDSKDEIENLDLAKKLCKAFGIEDFEKHIQYTRDRPFNDCRYAVNGDKLAKLGWKQKVSFEEGLAQCVDWYQKYSTWWGDINKILTPFPELHSKADGPAVDRLCSHNSGAGDAGRQAGVGAEPYDPASAGKKLKGWNGSANGSTSCDGGAVNGGAVKKRKAEALEDE
ncbi:Putative dTDP-glucose 4,6-dehydratase, NAD(P)-binding domain, NAD(P)-binding domain superfamily [Septoria linicola]|uniref:dTDP-glucose 4,6-dehydratase, NAD(P)-binding domain, NAD(P)-binding domain superfamily n=1 Tax=Septoria linicola TaxID=215465 RepID=A0A9Q9EK21_9PEZI|nr:Putative dTDP-glucose 4,6-dehydratase, NAD(P)-binding domain, NAD(P)-binding domain superfamily [Septoria linicola]